MKTFEKFNEFSLNELECKQIKGGEAAWCTSMSCFSTLDAAVQACFHTLGCTGVYVVYL